MSTRILKWALVVLVVANILVAAAWWARDDLVKAGVLSTPPQRVDLGERLLPPIVAVEAEDEPLFVAESTLPQPEPAPPPQPDTPASPQAASGATPQPVATASPQPIAVPPDEQGANTLACIVAGPFQDKPSAEATAARIEAAGGSAQIEAEAVTTIRAYLVYVAPTDNEAAAGAYRELTEVGIDAYLIPSGARQNGVSVGVFSSQKRATAQRDRVAALGHSVLIHPLERVATVYRVAARNAPSAQLADVATTPCGGAETP